MKRNRGFTLIELMIVVVVIGILAAIAFPAYDQFRIKANRSAAQQFMMDIATQQKQYMLDARTYVAVAANSDAAAWGKLGLTIPNEVSAFYNIKVDTPTVATFSITAKAKGGTIQAGDADLTLNQAGVTSW
ncbi:MAG: type IV pilin protein [Hydrogenophaga sp.]